MIHPIARLSITGLLLALVAGCACPCAATGTSAKITPALQPAQGKWHLVATSKADGPLAPFVGTNLTISGNTLTLGGGAGLTKLVALTPSKSNPNLYSIALTPLKGQPGWSLAGIAKWDGNIWTMNLANPADKLAPADFFPRDDGTDVVVLRKE
jgi:hypothetical protein